MLKYDDTNSLTSYDSHGELCMYDYLFNKQVSCQLLDEELFEHDDEILL